MRLLLKLVGLVAFAGAAFIAFGAIVGPPGGHRPEPKSLSITDPMIFHDEMQVAVSGGRWTDWADMSGHSWVTRSEYSPGLQVALVGIVGTTPIKMISIIRNRYAHQTVSGDIAKLLVDPVYAASLYGFETQCDALAGGQERWVATGGLLVWCEGSSGRLGGEYVTTFIAAYPASLSPQIYVDTAKARKAKRKK